MPGDANLPVPTSKLDRSAMERVLARAAELQAGSGEPEEALSEEQILELGKEVGLSPQHLRQALAEERTRVSVPGSDSGVGARLFGAASAGASRTVPGRPQEILEVIDDFMQRQESLQVKRKFADRIVWEARSDFVGAARRALNIGGRGYALARAHEVAATAIALDDQRTLVRVDADLVPYRGGLVRQTAGLSVVGAASAGVLVTLGFFAPIAIAPAVLIAAGAFYGARSMNHRVTSAAQLALEQLLDRLERGELTKGQPSLLSVLAAAASNLPRRL
jgi:hypothetical protein